MNLFVMHVSVYHFMLKFEVRDAYIENIFSGSQRIKFEMNYIGF